MGGLDWSILFRPPYSDELIAGIRLTVEIAVYGWIGAMILGLVVGLAREAPSAVVRTLATAHVELFRNIPVLVQLFFCYFVLPLLLPLTMRRALFRLGWEEISAIIALMPLALGIGTGAELHQPLAIAIIGGFVTAIPLLLLVLPTGMLFVFKNRNVSETGHFL